MTDNRTTELREMLTERGVEYTTNDHMGVCETSWNGFTAMQLTPSAKLIMTVTPEQAIAATLGSDTSAARLAEKLRDIADEMRNVGASSMKPHELLACYAREVDKVADSLKFAATLGNGTCEMRLLWCDYEDGECYECSSCEGMTYTHGWEPSYCEKCGAKVVKR